MKPGARVQAAIDILNQIAEEKNPAESVLKTWARKNRYAGSKDRAQIRSYVFDVIRNWSSLAWTMDSDAAHALIVGCLADHENEHPEWRDWFDGEGHNPEPLSPEEQEKLSKPRAEYKPDWVKHNVPEWLLPDLEKTFGVGLTDELAALNERAPIDLRVNRLKVVRKAARAHLRRADIATHATPHAEFGLRVEPPENSKLPDLTKIKPFLDGEFEIQDEGSQLVVSLANAGESQQVIELCAGGGGKTVALADAMKNKGQIFACDIDKRRLENIRPRMQRANVRNVQLRVLQDWSPKAGETDPDLEDLKGAVDLVVADVPCSGSGAWRRHPDAKWRLTETNLDHYRRAQARILQRAALLTKPGGAILYITCSVLESENDDQINAFLKSHDEFEVCKFDTDIPRKNTEFGTQLTPYTTGTDGFYISRLQRKL